MNEICVRSRPMVAALKRFVSGTACSMLTIALAPDLIVNLAAHVARSVTEPDSMDDGRLEVTGRPEDQPPVCAT